jgi:single-strand DNA-binding protein
MALNHAAVQGNLTRDPELQYTANQTALCKFSVAWNRKWAAQDGTDRSEVLFLECTCWGKRGETINQYFNKGKPIIVEGRLKFDSWTAQDGTKRSRVSLTVEQFHFVGGRDDGQGGGQQGQGGGQQGQYGAQQGGGAANSGQQGYGGAGDDIPF